MSPLETYRARHAARSAMASALARWDAAASWARFATFVAACVIAVAAFKGHLLSGAWLLAPGSGFVTLVIVHDRIVRSRERAEKAAQLYTDGIARIEDRAPPGDGRSLRFADEHHVYATDLDLFGRGSLFERLSTARTSMGEETLSAWLRAPAPPDRIRARQEATRELGPSLDLKEDLAVMGMNLGAEVNPMTLATWAAGPAVAMPPGIPGGMTGARVVSALLGLVLTVAVLLWLEGRTSPWLLTGAALLALGWTARLRSVVAPVALNVERRAAELELLALMLARLERASFRAPLLVELRRALETTASAGARSWPPSRRVAQLARLVDLLDARRNQIFAILSVSLLWTTQLALAVESWRRAFGPAIASWLGAVGEIEALASLSTYAFENPELPFPTISDAARTPVFEAEALGHPLIPAATRVTNDVTLGGPAGPRLLLVSGSNMSGKSTWRRTVGVNVVLAQAGAPVCARRLELSPLALGATLRIHDSLAEGRSRFYAEITRLRQIVDLAAGAVPVLFLLDELLSGTNSHDRGVGARSILLGLLDRNAIGIATTHDLALAEMATSLGTRARNVHFSDELRGSELVFDYRMRPGIVRHSNALALMRAVGLHVEADGAGP